MARKKKNRKGSKASIKRIAATAVLAGGLLISTPSASNAHDVKPKGETIPDRVKMVRKALGKKLAVGQSAQGKLSYSEMELAQWNNWGNWNNWYNWYNWNNWNNWANWGNWRNF